MDFIIFFLLIYLIHNVKNYMEDNMENTNLSTQKIFNKNILKFLLPSLLGLILFVIPLPYGDMINLEGLSSYNIGIGFLAELIRFYLQITYLILQ